MKFLMNSAFKWWIAALLIISVPDSLLMAQSSTPEFDRLKSSFDGGEIFTASFTHDYYDSFTEEQQSSSGTIWIAREHYKIEGDNQLVLVDGETSTVYDGSKNRVIISDYIEEEDDFAPSRMLQGVDDSYDVSETSLPEGGTRVELLSDDPFAIFTSVSIYLDSEGIPVEIEAVDQVDNRLITRFENGSFLPDEPDEIFTLDTPEDAELIDLRYDS
jgi:outer membrane lipoprotein-sorting protein